MHDLEKFINVAVSWMLDGIYRFALKNPQKYLIYEKNGDHEGVALYTNHVAWY